MPGLNGLQLCHKIRAHTSGSAGADDYLTKPLDPDDLRARLTGVAYRYRLEAVQGNGSAISLGEVLVRR
jgi:DNA-binding response OmpR family regulator